MLVGDKLHNWDAYLNPKTLAWTRVGDAGKSDFNAEEGWTLLPDGRILTADVANAPNSEIYNPATGRWKSARLNHCGLALSVTVRMSYVWARPLLLSAR